MSVARPVLEVLEPGFLTSVQDAGRAEAGRWGVPRGGAADSRSLELANALLGNPPGAAILEATVVGPLLRALAKTRVALAGADLQAYVAETGERLPPGGAVTLRAGQTLVCRGPSVAGARACIAVAGGVDVPTVLGSRSTALGAGFGGLDGRALRAGDVIRAPGDDGAPRGSVTAIPPGGPSDVHLPASGLATVRITLGPDADGPADARIAALAGTSWFVMPASDRMGVRLQGPSLPVDPGAAERASFGVLPGAIQVPPDGQPIVLLVDAQPTGGYPVPAVVARVDLHLLAQLRPGDTVRFAPVAREAAVVALRAALLRGSR